MKTVAVISQKGGSTKTTTVLSLAVSAVAHDKSTIVFDTDPQVSATKWYDRRKARGDDAPYVKAIQSARLNHELERARMNGADLAIIDTPPHGMGDAQNLAYRAADLVIIPTHASVFDTDAIEQTKTLLDRLDKPAYILISALRPESITRFSETRDYVSQKFDIPVLDFFIPELYAFKDAPLLGQTPREFQPQSAAAQAEQQLYQWLAERLWS